MENWRLFIHKLNFVVLLRRLFQWNILNVHQNILFSNETFRKHSNCFKKALIIFKIIYIDIKPLLDKTSISLPSKHPRSLHKHNNKAKILNTTKKKFSYSSKKKKLKFSCVIWDITYFKHFSDSDDMTIK